jgi:hypothetical protein
MYIGVMIGYIMDYAGFQVRFQERLRAARRNIWAVEWVLGIKHKEGGGGSTAHFFAEIRAYCQRLCHHHQNPEH